MSGLCGISDSYICPIGLFLVTLALKLKDIVISLKFSIVSVIAIPIWTKNRDSSDMASSSDNFTIPAEDGIADGLVG